MKQKGFVLIELVVVMLVIGTLVAVLMVTWPGDKANLIGQSEQLVNDIRYMQTLATTNNATYCMNFSGGTQYTLNESDCTTGVPHPATESSTIPLGSNMSLSTDLVGNHLLFDRKGVPSDDAGELTADKSITMVSANSSAVITISAETGKVTLS